MIKLKQLLEMSKDEIIGMIKSITDEHHPLWWLKHGTTKSNLFLVAHVDSVYEKRKKVLYDPEYGLYIAIGNPLGADDRAGVYALLSLMDTGASLLFLDGEESGGLGAYTFCSWAKSTGMDKEVSAFIEMDRRGRNDVVFYHEEPKKFKKLFGAYRETTGIFSDVDVIGRELGISSANLSVGFQDNHLDHETLNHNHLMSSIKNVRKIISQWNNKKWRVVSKSGKWGWMRGKYDNNVFSKTDFSSYGKHGMLFNTSEGNEYVDEYGEVIYGNDKVLDNYFTKEAIILYNTCVYGAEAETCPDADECTPYCWTEKQGSKRRGKISKVSNTDKVSKPDSSVKPILPGESFKEGSILNLSSVEPISVVSTTDKPIESTGKEDEHE